MVDSVEQETTTKRGGTKVAVPKIYSAIAAIQSEIGSIPKNGVGPAAQGSYKFISNDDIVDSLSKLLSKHKVIVQPKTLDYQMVTREIGANRTVALTSVTLETTYISIEDGSEFKVVTVGEGADNGDKGARKAYTQAAKVANLLTFAIATGEPDPDAIDAPINTPAVATQSPAAKKIANASKGADASSLFNEIKVFLGSNGLNGSVANALGERLSGGKPSSEWSTDVNVLGQVLKALKAGEVE
jgi:hypothetical protein